MGAPSYLTALPTSDRMAHEAVLSRHDRHDDGIAALREDIQFLRDELWAHAQRLQAIKAAMEADANRRQSTQLHRALRALRLI